ncbi:MAG: threonylcarbamoyl-AMP synthase [Clostridia bacterium]|nr:threonylcarbamoyl-AMP synthase [Clostridia bacterium]
METKIYQVNSNNDTAAIKDAADILRRGGLVVFPTETVYGLGGNATDPEAAKAIYAAKGRPSDNPLIIHVASPEDAEPYAVTSDAYYRLARRFMPGPLTVILPKKDTIPLSVTGGLETVAVRCPAHPVAQELIKAAGLPIAAPSANRSGKPSPTCAAHVIEDLLGRVDVILDGGDCEVGLESTIVKLDGESGVLLRPGAITPEDLESVLSDLSISPAVTAALREGERVLSPGMKYRHYAPSAPLTLLEGEEDAVRAFLIEKANDHSIVILCFEEELPLMPEGASLFPVGKRADLEAQAHRLFSALRDADHASHIRQLYAHLPSKTGLGLALYNRAIRAAAHTILHIDRT